MRIMLADNRRKVRFALRALLEQQSSLEVIGEAIDAQDLMACVENSCPDVVLLDWELPGMATHDLLSALRSACPELLIIALSGRVSGQREALAAGVDAFVSTGEPPERLLSAINRCEKGCSSS